MNENNLKLHVIAVNRANAEANRIAPILQAFFAPLVGRKIEKTDGSLLQKLKEQLPEFPNQHNLRVVRSSSVYSMSWCVYASENDGTGHASHEVTVYVGDLNGPVLERVLGPHQVLRTDYTFEEVKENYQNAKAAKKVFEEIADKCKPFFRADQIH